MLEFLRCICQYVYEGQLRLKSVNKWGKINLLLHLDTPPCSVCLAFT